MDKRLSRKITYMAFLVALEVVLTRLGSFNAPIVRIGFGFLPIAIAGMLFGPAWGGLAGMLGDIIGITLFPTGAFFPGFTLTAALTGMTYGALLYKQRTLPRIIGAAAIVTLVIQLGLDTYWLKIITGEAYRVLFPPRIFKCVLLLPIQVLMIRYVGTTVLRLIAINTTKEHGSGGSLK